MIAPRGETSPITWYRPVSQSPPTLNNLRRRNTIFVPEQTASRCEYNTSIAIMQREDITYFGAGPAALPTEVLADAAVALQNYNETGLYVTSAFPAGVQLLIFFL